jgi:hypothetical protein
MNNQIKPQPTIFTKNPQVECMHDCTRREKMLPRCLKSVEGVIEPSIRLVFRGYDLSMQHCYQAVDLGVKV